MAVLSIRETTDIEKLADDYISTIEKWYPYQYFVSTFKNQEIEQYLKCNISDDVWHKNVTDYENYIYRKKIVKHSFIKYEHVWNRNKDSLSNIAKKLINNLYHSFQNDVSNVFSETLEDGISKHLPGLKPDINDENMIVGSGIYKENILNDLNRAQDRFNEIDLKNIRLSGNLCVIPPRLELVFADILKYTNFLHYVVDYNLTDNEDWYLMDTKQNILPLIGKIEQYFQAKGELFVGGSIRFEISGEIKSRFSFSKLIIKVVNS